MPESEFSVDYFKHLFIYELRDVYSHGLPHLLPPRTLGSTVSYDFGVYNDRWRLNIEGKDIDSHMLRSLMPVQRRAILPNKYVSVFIRFFAPFHVTSSRTKDPVAYEYWRERGFRGYFRWDADINQHRLLAELEHYLGDTGFVCCAAPAFALLSDCDVALASGTVLQRTNFLFPSAIRNQEYYSYVSANISGRAYPDAQDPAPVSILKEIVEAQTGAAVEPFITHVSRLWTALYDLTISNADEDAIYDGSKDMKTAELTLGSMGFLPVDPLHIMSEGRFSLPIFEPGDQSSMTLNAFAAAILAIQRIVREKMGCEWIVFYN